MSPVAEIINLPFLELPFWFYFETKNETVGCQCFRAWRLSDRPCYPTAHNVPEWRHDIRYNDTNSKDSWQNGTEHSAVK